MRRIAKRRAALKRKSVGPRVESPSSPRAVSPAPQKKPSKPKADAKKMFKEVSAKFPLFSLSMETFVACCDGRQVISEQGFEVAVVGEAEEAVKKHVPVVEHVPVEHVEEPVREPVDEAEAVEEAAVGEASEEEAVEDDAGGKAEAADVKEDPPLSAPGRTRGRQLTIERVLGKQEAVGVVSSKLFGLQFPKYRLRFFLLQ